MNAQELKDFLDQKVVEFNNPRFIESDPIQIPHQFSLKEDIEIAGFLTATIAWGNRKMIIKNASRMMDYLGNSPYDFVMNHSEENLLQINNFVHRTFNSLDFQYFIKALKNIYTNHQGLEQVFTNNASTTSIQPAIHNFKQLFFELEHLQRTEKHISDPFKNSAAKRINILIRLIMVAN